jgi:hypothetical protein
MAALTAISDPYAQRSTEISSQARGAYAVSPNDGTDLNPPAKALYVGSAGDLVVLPINATDDSQTVTLANHPVGYVPIQVRRVFATGTIAAGIIALTDSV